MDPVQVPVVSGPANSFGLLLVGVGLLCLGLGVGWWWKRTPHHENEESQADASDSNPPSNTDREERSSGDIPGDTGEFVFATEESDSESFDFANEESADNDAVDRGE